MRGERICVVDKTKYVYCPHCNHGNPDETWRYLYCSERCRDIFDTLSSWKSGKLDVQSARDKLEALDVYKTGYYQSNLKNNIDEIMATATRILPKTKVEEEIPKSKPRRKRKIVNED